LKSKSRIEKYKRYGLSKEEYTKLITINDGRCHICNIPSKTYIDHCHKSNKVRGILCPKCNTALGFFDDNITILLTAINYLKKNS